jgi:DNA-binding winged helix-turn-helix (wHTH) protein
LIHGSEPVRLGRRPIALLLALVEQPGAVVSKNALIEAAWPNQIVEEANLTVQIAALRRVLSQEPGGDRWIETMPRRGYRFIGPVVTGEKNGVIATPTWVDTARIDAPREVTPIEHGEAERRQITALSCELVRVAAGAHGTDLEDLREAVAGFRRCVSETAGRHEGFIYRHLGNNVLALFGSPEAHEHRTKQAVRAGLELCTAVGTLTSGANTTMRCRVGIATGVVIIDDVGEVVGDTPDLAVRLRMSAQPDTVAIDPVTQRLIGNLFDCRELGSIEANSGTEEIRRWQVAGEHRREPV